MDTWESFFREKSRRRSRPVAIRRAVKGAILLVLFGSAAASVFMWVAGLPR
jgi:hypothetical protein